MLFSCGVDNSKEEQKISKEEAIYTFAKIYGDLRYFHPSSEAQKIDWDLLAIYGVDKLKNVKTKKELRENLIDIFKPIAPLLQINDQSELDNYFTQYKNQNLDTVFYQHYGFGGDGTQGVYKKSRVNIKNQISLNREFSSESFLLGGFENINDSLKIELISNHKTYNWNTRTRYFLGYKENPDEKWRYSSIGLNESSDKVRIDKKLFLSGKPSYLKLVVRLVNQGLVST